MVHGLIVYTAYNVAQGNTSLCNAQTFKKYFNTKYIKSQQNKCKILWRNEEYSQTKHCKSAFCFEDGASLIGKLLSAGEPAGCVTDSFSNGGNKVVRAVGIVQAFGGLTIPRALMRAAFRALRETARKLLSHLLEETFRAERQRRE